MEKNKESKEQTTNLSDGIFTWPATHQLVKEAEKFKKDRKRFQLPPGGGRTKKTKR